MMTYTIKITRSNGRTTTLKDAESHSVILEGRTMSIILRDGRRFLIPMDGREFEFSKELDAIIRENEKRTN